MQIANDVWSGQAAELALQSAQGAQVAGVQSSREAAAAHEFEALLATQLVAAMRQTLPDGFFGKGSGADIYESWLDQHLGNALARDEALGIAGVLKAAWQRTPTEGPTS